MKKLLAILLSLAVIFAMHVKKLLAILLSLAVIFAMLPVGVFADETGDQPQGGPDINAGDDSKPEIDPDKGRSVISRLSKDKMQ